MGSSFHSRCGGSMSCQRMTSISSLTSLTSWTASILHHQISLPLIRGWGPIVQLWNMETWWSQAWRRRSKYLALLFCVPPSIWWRCNAHLLIHVSGLKRDRELRSVKERRSQRPSRQGGSKKRARLPKLHGVTWKCTSLPEIIRSDWRQARNQSLLIRLISRNSVPGSILT